MSAILIYADTTVWNALCDQAADAGKLAKDLAVQRAQLVLGTNAVYEMAKTFKGSRPTAEQRGKELFSYVLQYVHLGIPLLRQTDDLLRQEARVVRKETKDIELFYGGTDYEKLVTEVDKLSRGIFDSRAAQFIPLRESDAKQSRADMSSYIEERPVLKRKLTAIRQESLDRWIAQEMKASSRVRRMLAAHLWRVINGQSLGELTWLAKRLLASSCYRVSHALVRSDLYLNWRYCQRGSLGKDIPDDNYHAVNASYCDLFVTTDPGLAEYMSHVLTQTNVEFYERGRPLANWLVALDGKS